MTCESEYDVYVLRTGFIKWTPNGEAYADLNAFFVATVSRGLYQIWYPGVYIEDVEKMMGYWSDLLYVKPKSKFNEFVRDV
jgi:hypothetical protein